MLGGLRGGEGAAFFVLRPAQAGDPFVVEPVDDGLDGPDPEADAMGFLGAAWLPVIAARRLLRGEDVQFRGPGRLGLRFAAS